MVASGQLYEDAQEEEEDKHEGLYETSILRTTHHGLRARGEVPHECSMQSLEGCEGIQVLFALQDVRAQHCAF